MRLALKCELDGVSRQLLADVLRRVLVRTWSLLVVCDVAILVDHLHLIATKAKTRAFVFLHFVHKEVISGSIGIRRRVAVFRPHYNGRNQKS